MKTRILAVILLTAIMSLCFLLMTYRLGSEIYYGGDDILLPSLVMSSRSLLWILFHSYGIITPLISEIFARIILSFGIPINEFWWIFPFAAIGTFTVFFIYLLIKELTGSEGQALFGSAFIALMPWYLSRSRYSYGYETVNLFLAILSLYTFILYLKRRFRIAGIIFTVTVSCYVMSHTLSFFILIILIYSALVFIPKGSNLTLGYELKNIFHQKYFIVPIILALFLFLEGVYCAPVSHRAYVSSFIWGSLMNKMPTSINLNYYLQTMIGHCLIRIWRLMGSFLKAAKLEYLVTLGYWPFLTLLSLPFGIKDTLVLSKRSIFFIWGGLYVIPFFLFDFFDASQMVVENYFTFGVVPLSIYFALVIYENINKLYGKYVKCIACKILFWIVIGCFFFQLSHISYSRLKSGRLDSGIKTMGFYIRNYTSTESILYCVEDGYLYPLTAEYYFGREASYDDFQEKRETVKQVFEKNIKDIDIIILTPDHQDYFSKFKDFEVKVRVFAKRGALGKDTLLLLYARRNLNLPEEEMDIQEFNSLFDRQFSYNFCRNKGLTGSLTHFE